jgi:hypothetical protein
MNQAAEGRESASAFILPAFILYISAMTRPSPERRELAKVVERDRRCRNCGHGQAIPQNLTQLVCMCLPPTPLLLRAEVDDKGRVKNLLTAKTRPIVEGVETCGSHEFPEEIAARRAKSALTALKMEAAVEIGRLGNPPVKVSPSDEPLRL